MSFIFETIQFDSQEEVYFYLWLEEAKFMGYVRKYIYQPESILLADKVVYNVDKALKTKTKTETKTLLGKSSYTADYLVWFTDKLLQDYPKLKLSPVKLNIVDIDKPFYIEIKPSYDQNNMTRAFKIKQKWIYDKFKIYICLIKPKIFFKHTFLPSRLSYTKSNNISTVIKGVEK